MHKRNKLPDSADLAMTNEIRPLIFASADDHPACREIADVIAAALNDDYPNAVSVTSLVEIEECASRGPVVVVPVLMRNLDMVARSCHVSKHNVAIVGWTDRLGMAHWDQFDVESFLQERGVVIASDFRVNFGLEPSHLQVCTNADHRHLSVSVVEGENLKCLPVVEVPNDAVDDQTMYFPVGAYLPAELDAETELIATEVSAALHRKFCTDYSRTEFTLASGRLIVSAFIPCPVLTSGSLITSAAKLVGLSFEDLCWELVAHAAGKRFGVVDVHSDGPYPGDVLSNFYPHSFHFRGVECASVEGLLQGLKFQDPERQLEIVKLIGSAAKLAGAAQSQEWMASGLLWWRGNPIGRHTEQYQTFLHSIFKSVLTQSAAFRNALEATRGRAMTHRVGSRHASQTVLTERELVKNLMQLKITKQSGSSI